MLSRISTSALALAARTTTRSSHISRSNLTIKPSTFPAFPLASLRSFSLSAAHWSPKQQVIEEDEDADEVVIKKPKKATASKKAATPKVPKEKAAPKPKAVKKVAEKKPKAVAAKPKTVAKKATAKKPRVTSAVKLPKRIGSVWLLYYQDRIPDLRAAVPEGEKFSVAKAAQAAAEDYKRLSKAEKDALNVRLQEEKANYKVAMGEAMEKLTPEIVKKENQFRKLRRSTGSHKRNLIDPKKPKKPMSAFFIYLDDKRSDADWLEEAKQKIAVEGKQGKNGLVLNPRINEFAAAAAQAGDEWRSMTEEQKQPFVELAQQALVNYREAMIEYTGTSTSSSSASNGSDAPAATHASEEASALASF